MIDLEKFLEPKVFYHATLSMRSKFCRLMNLSANYQNMQLLHELHVQKEK